MEYYSLNRNANELIFQNFILIYKLQVLGKNPIEITFLVQPADFFKQQ